MKLRLLLFMFLMSGGFLYAQDTINTLIISESNMFRADGSYVELTNVGTEPIQMSDFEFGIISPWHNAFPWTAEKTSQGTSMRLPNKMLQPGESFVMATVMDFVEKMHPLDPDNYAQRITPIQYWQWADMQIHVPEAKGIPGLDSITPNSGVMGTWAGRDCWYLEQHLSNGDSVVVDQVGGVFDNPDGKNYDKSYDVAGVTGATGNSILVRKFNVKKGNLNFAEARGIDIEDSEWIPIPLSWLDQAPWRSAFWTMGNHGNYKLDENTFISDKIQVDLANKVMTAAWGTRNLDDFMFTFEQKPGIGWYYDLSPAREDSAYVSARNGDMITVYVAGNGLMRETFDIVLAPPTADANLVLPKFRTQANGYYPASVVQGNQEAYNVTVDMPGMDTITNGLFGIGYASRVDTLLKYLEKAPKASWEIDWMDDTPRTDVKNGDILKITAENGDVKEYYIKVNAYRPSHNAQLSSITWPDIPTSLKGILGWTGDTIPNFSPLVYNYRIQVPLEVDGIPALIAKTQQLNATIDVKRASSLQGSIEQQTITFTVTAQDGVEKRVYKVQLLKEKNPANTQPYYAEPFLSELVFQDQYDNGFVEIANPGNQILDLSNYMIAMAWTDDIKEVIEGYSGVDNWGTRLMKYIPGYKWVDESTWAVSPGTVVQDANVNTILYPQDVFVAGHVANTSGWNDNFPGPIKQKQVDVILNSPYNPWNETYTNWGSAVKQWCNNNFYLFKITNDSITKGLKSANDPNDFELIEVFGMGDGTDWNIGGYSGVGATQCATFIRKPQYTVGKATHKESFGTTQDDTEWIRYDEPYWISLNTGWPAQRLNATKDLGQHFMYEVTSYKSTVTSTVYLVSEGYSMKETIKGVKTGTTVATFMANLIKADEDQALKIHSMEGGIELSAADMVSLNDTLIVISADSTNISKYILNVSAEGLSSDAVLTSSRYTIITEGETGTIIGFDYGTALKTVWANTTVPAGAHVTVINGQGAYVSMQQLNFDSTLVNVTVNDNTYFSVVAEDGITSIVYQLIPNATEDDAFLTSVVYDVVQKDVLIKFVPRGTSVSTLLGNLVPSAGASMKLVDKMGHERLDGGIADDDKVVVTSPNGMKTTVYFLAMLAERYNKNATYLAYILSNIYVVDQEGYTVNEVSGAETIAEFYSRITPSMGATAVVVDKDGNEKTTGTIERDDEVKVTSADGKIVVMYQFGSIVSSRTIETSRDQY